MGNDDKKGEWKSRQRGSSAASTLKGQTYSRAGLVSTVIRWQRLVFRIRNLAEVGGLVCTVTGGNLPVGYRAPR